MTAVTSSFTRHARIVAGRYACSAVPARRILLVAQIAPPSPLSAARRVAGLARHLDRLGHEVTVLTSMLSGSGPIAGAARVVRTRDLLASGVNWRRENFAALEGGAGDVRATEPRRDAAGAGPGRGLVAAVRAAAGGRAWRAAPTACSTTAPARSAHLIGLALARRGLPWVADFRDGWGFEDQRPTWAHPALDRLDARSSARSRAQRTSASASTRPITEDLRERLGARAETITNGFDPEDPDAAARAAPARRTAAHRGPHRQPRLRRPRPAPASSTRCGSCARGAGGRRRAAVRRPRLGRRARGDRGARVAGQLRALGSLPRAEALALQRSAARCCSSRRPAGEHRHRQALRVLRRRPPDPRARRAQRGGAARARGRARASRPRPATRADRATRCAS